MHDEIKKIVQMNKDGQISDDQMADMIEALKSPSAETDQESKEACPPLVEKEHKSTKKEAHIKALLGISIQCFDARFCPFLRSWMLRGWVLRCA